MTKGNSQHTKKKGLGFLSPCRHCCFQTQLFLENKGFGSGGEGHFLATGDPSPKVIICVQPKLFDCILQASQQFQSGSKRGGDMLSNLEKKALVQGFKVFFFIANSSSTYHHSYDFFLAIETVYSLIIKCYKRIIIIIGHQTHRL